MPDYRPTSNSCGQSNKRAVNTMLKDRSEGSDSPRKGESLNRERSRGEDRSIEAEYQSESYHLKSGHIRAGGGWLIRRKNLERRD